MANGGPNTEGTPSAAMPNIGKQLSKPAGGPGSKMADNNRKQAGTLSDGAQRRNVTTNAWASKINPITGQANGAGTQLKPLISKAPMNQESKSAETLGNDRLVFLLGSCMGLNVNLTTIHGDIFSGIYFGASMENDKHAHLVKMVQRKKLGEKGEMNGIEDGSYVFAGSGEDHTMSFDFKDVLGLAVDGVQFGTQDKQQNGFRTDTDVSGGQAPRERELQPWTASVETDVDLSLEQPGSGSGEAWDQFKANERLFGLKTDYNEEIYTTTIDRSNPSYREREARAQRLVREIEGSATSDTHTLEERGITDAAGGLDEEAKYSSVRRQVADYPPLQSSGANRYMPPARRPPSGKPTVPGAPVDPAIISSQIARTDTNSQAPNTALAKPAENNTEAASSGDATSSEAKQEAIKDSPREKAVVTNESRPVNTPKAQAPNATANVETEALHAFQKFAHFEKTRVAEDRKKRAVADKNIKLNDLKKFSTNFKLHTPVPKDLVPILAKDTVKQNEIVEKAQREAELKAATPPKALASSGDQASSRLPIDSKHDGTRAPPNTAINERQDYTHPRQSLPPRGPQAGMQSRDKPFSSMFPGSPHAGQGMLGPRLADQHSRHKAGIQGSIPTPLPIHTAQKPPSRPSVNVTPMPGSNPPSAIRTPTSAASARFNVKAPDFKPNPAANTFKPTGVPSAASSPRSSAIARPLSRDPTPGDFFGSKKPLPPGEKASILENFNPLKRLKEKAEKENKAKDYVANGGIVYAHATPVTWSHVEDDAKFKSYKDMFEDLPPVSRGATPQHPTASPVNPALLHQLPPHLQLPPQGIPHVQAPPQQAYQGPPQTHHYPGLPNPHQFEDQRIHASPSAPAYSTPRMPHTYVAYPPPMAPPMQYTHGQPMPQFAMGPGAPQPQNFRQLHGNATYGHSPGQQYAAPMMVHNSSQGGYMAPQGMPGTQMPMFPQGQTPPYAGQSQPPSGYPSPGRPAPMMVHQGSYQGHNPPMYMNGAQYGTPVYAQQQPPHTTPMRAFASAQPPYNQSPHQQTHYPPPMGRQPSNSYVHHPQGQYQHMQGQHPPPAGVAMEGGTE
ncbi:hypothetical protein OEA41_003052 [Lepraria neglecta]|uniref:LsmAD domain-containing protein n=1 Tax=Lepraria neglecta TaxID=209136 RepID=A0AAE0DL59_9LECA|nr:hypothetical protein OEA41_003052 [Lepraria neglecta]